MVFFSLSHFLPPLNLPNIFLYTPILSYVFFYLSLAFTTFSFLKLMDCPDYTGRALHKCKYICLYYHTTLIIHGIIIITLLTHSDKKETAILFICSVCVYMNTHLFNTDCCPRTWWKWTPVKWQVFCFYSAFWSTKCKM